MYFFSLGVMKICEAMISLTVFFLGDTILNLAITPLFTVCSLLERITRKHYVKKEGCNTLKEKNTHPFRLSRVGVDLEEAVAGGSLCVVDFSRDGWHLVVEIEWPFFVNYAEHGCYR